VAQVVVLASRCGEAGSDAVQLAVVRALLTVVTAEHFVVHGDCLMQARAAPRHLAWRAAGVPAHGPPPLVPVVLLSWPRPTTACNDYAAS